MVALVNRSHGASHKVEAPADDRSELIARDAANLLVHPAIERADAMGFR